MAEEKKENPLVKMAPDEPKISTPSNLPIKIEATWKKEQEAKTKNPRRIS